MAKVKCSHCHGTGKVTCSACKGRGRRKCPTCRSYGHACPVCTKGWDSRPGYVKDKYGDWVHCPNCHGDYTNRKFTCWRCGGEGVIDCDKTERCSVCDGTGKVDKVSKCNLRLFRAFSMAFGFSGLQYLYVGRWCLFLLQFATFALLAAVVLFWDPNGAIATYVARFCGAGSDAESVKLQTEVFLGILLVSILLTGMFAIKRDRRGGLLTDDYKREWFWVFFLFFGITGAHLAYTKERLLLVIHLLWITAPTAIGIISSASKGRGVSDFVPGLIAMFVFTIAEAVLARVANAMFDTHFLDKDK